MHGWLDSQFSALQGKDVFPIPGTKSVKYLEQNAAALQVKLTADEKLQLKAGFASDQVKRWHQSVVQFALRSNDSCTGSESVLFMFDCCVHHAMVYAAKNRERVTSGSQPTRLLLCAIDDNNSQGVMHPATRVARTKTHITLLLVMSCAWGSPCICVGSVLFLLPSSQPD